MAGSVGQEVEEEKIARWKRLGELEISEAFRQSGASEASISKVHGLINREIIDREKLDEIAKCLDLPDGRCLPLALLGRGVSSSIAEFDFGYLTFSLRNPLNEDEAKALCVNLASNTNVRIVHLAWQKEFGTPQGCTLIANALTTNDALKELDFRWTEMGPEAVKNLMEGVRRNKSLEILNLAGNPLCDEGIGYVAQMLSSHTTLKSLNLLYTEYGDEGAKHVSAALESNTSLERFTIGDRVGKIGMAMLLKPLIHDQDGDATTSAGPKNRTITHLELLGLNKNAVESVASMIRTNKTLSSLSLPYARLEPRDWVEQIILALKQNHTLESLDLSRCRGLTVEGVLIALLDLVRFSNTGLQKIVLEGTELESKAGIVSEELRLNEEYRGRLRNQIKVKPKSGRLVLCGYEYAGKTSICETMQRMGHDTPRSHYWKTVWKKILKTHPRRLRNFFFRKNAYKELQDRTRGIDIVVLQKKPHTISIWDFAGQREYYALHDYLFPNVSNSCFLYICNATCPPDDQNRGRRKIKDKDKMREEFLFWMKFIASNSKSSIVRNVSGERQLPRVTFVLSNKDKLSQKQRGRSTQWAEAIVSELKEIFEDIIALSEDVEVVNAHYAKDVWPLLKKVNIRLKAILWQSTEYAICESVRHALENYVIENRFTPLLSMEDFQTIIESTVPAKQYRDAALYTPLGRETVLNYLNASGEVIYSKGLGFIVVNPRWFGLGVLGSLINIFGGAKELQPTVRWSSVCDCFKASGQEPSETVHEQGFVSRKRIVDILKQSLQIMSLQKSNISAQNLIDLMIKLEMCFEKHPGNVNSQLFVPALFDVKTDDSANKGERKLKWKIEHPPGEHVHYIGRRLVCENDSLTFLTPGFFPRLQVVLWNFLHEQKWTENKDFEVARNLIFFTNNGMEVFIEYSGDFDYFIDILVKSSMRLFAETLEVIESQVVKKILEFCASPQGCQGVQLVEAVIRPVCVRRLHLCVNRKPHAVLVSVLESKIYGAGGSKGYKHTWSKGIKDTMIISDVDFALDLLEGEGSYKRFIAANQIHQLEGSNPTGTFGTRYSSQGSSSTTPRCFYPTIDDIGIIRRFGAKIAEVMPIQIHLMCENRDDDPHQVEGQPGRTLNLNRSINGNNLPIMKYVVSILWAGVKAVGSMGNLPVDILPMDKWIEKLWSTPEMLIPFDKLDWMKDYDKTPRPASDEEVLNYLKRYLKMDSSAEWLTGFLELQDSGKFVDDFQLTKVIYTDTSEIGWLCRKHFDVNFQAGLVKRVPH